MTNCITKENLHAQWSKIEFGLRLAKLRQQKGISARQLSLDLGQNKNYINSIESGKNFPTMSGFIAICEYLHITPSDFFNTDDQNPVVFHYFEDILNQLTASQVHHLYQIAGDMIRPD